MARKTDAEATTTLNVSLPAALKSYVEKQVALGTYGSASEFVRQLIREHLERLERAHRLEDLLLEGIESGPPIEADTAYWRKKRQRLFASKRAKKAR